MAAVELATGYVTLTVDTRGIGKDIGRAFASAGSTGTTAGKTMGKAMSKSFAEAKPDMDALRADYDQVQRKIVQQAEVSARKQADAKRKVEIAQAKLNEATEKFGPKASQTLTAADRLATAEQRLEAETIGAKNAQEKLQGELKQSKSALDQAAGSSTGAAKKYAKGWRGIGQRIKGFMTKGVKEGGDASERQAKIEGKESGGRFSSAFKGALAGAVAAFSVGTIVNAGKEWINAAGDLEQSAGAIDTVFKGSAKTMHSWAANAADDVGLTKNEFNELGTLIGSQLKNGGTAMDQLAPKTNKLIGLGADLSSMFGGTTREAIEALSSALKGEMDPIEKYGISLNAAAIDAEGAALGMKKVGSSWDNASKQAIVLSLVTKQSKDALGNFSRESDTFSHKQQVMSAKWKNMTTVIGGFFMPIMAKAFTLVTDVAIPGLQKLFKWVGKTVVFKEITGGIKAFTDAWKRNDGAIASSGFPGFMEGLAFQLRQAFGYVKGTVIPAFGRFVGAIKENEKLVSFLATSIGGLAIAWAAWTVVTKTWSAVTKVATLVGKGFNLVLNANPIMKVITLVGLLVGAFVWLYKNNETARKIMQGAWKGIQNAVSFAWKNVIQPAVKGIVWFFKNVLAPTFNWFWKNVAKPAWQGISGIVKIAWAVIETAFLAMRWAFKNVLAPIFKWFWKTVVKPVWDGIGSKIKFGWEHVIKPILSALGKFIKERVAPGFKAGVIAIEAIWNKISSIAAKPINFVIGTVYNNGLRKALNLVRKVVGGSQLDPLPLIGTSPGGGHGTAGTGGAGRSVSFRAKGGFTPKGWTVVGEEGPELIDLRTPGRVYTADETAEAFKKAGTDVEPKLAQKLAGRKPADALLPMGGWFDNLKAAFGRGVKWIRGGLAMAAEKVISPLKSGVKSFIPSTTELGKTTRTALDSTFASTIKWIKGKDVVEDGGSGEVYDGPLGLFHRPSRGPITSYYGPRWGGFHSGIDIAGGGPTFAALPGVVQRVGWNTVPGKTGIGIYLNHGPGLWTYYGHNPVGGPRVRVGDHVKAGQHIGYQGATGNVTGTHVHFEVHKGRVNGIVNPLPYLHDRGGIIPTGDTMVRNKTQKPEALLNGTQWNAMIRLAEYVANTETGERSLPEYFILKVDGHEFKAYIVNTVDSRTRSQVKDLRQTRRQFQGSN